MPLSKRMTVKVKDSDPLPNVNDFTACLNGKTVSSKTDFVNGYHQVSMADSIEKTAITQLFGKFEYLYIHFGLKVHLYEIFWF